MASNRNGLLIPEGYYYRQLEYIYFNGTDNYIDTGINCRQIVEATYSFAFSTVPTGVNIIFGAYWDSSPNVPRMQFYYNNGWKDVSASLYTTTGTGIAQNGKATAGTIYTVTTKNKSSQASDSTLWVFARNSGNNTPLYANNLRIYSLSMTSGGVLVRDFIPVRVGQIGYLYDKVSGELFGNSGSGSFTLGNDVTT